MFKQWLSTVQVCGLEPHWSVGNREVFVFLFVYLFVSQSRVNTAIKYADVKQLQIEALFHGICTTILLHS